MDEQLYLIEEFEGQVEPISVSSGVNPLILKEAIKGSFRTSRIIEKKEQEFNGKKYPKHRVFYVTDLIFCSRKKFFETISKIDTMDDRGRIKTTLGTLLHKIIAENMFAGGEFEKRFVKDYKAKYLLVGRVDYLLPDAVIDFKLIAKDKMPSKPEQYYVDQILLYQWLTNRQKGYLVLINFYDGEIEVFTINEDKERLTYLLEKGLSLSDSFEKMYFPDPEPSYIWMCKGCIVDNCEHRKK